VDYLAVKGKLVPEHTEKFAAGYAASSRETVVFDMRQLLADTSDEVRKLMGGDVIQLHRLEPSMSVKLNSGWKDEPLMDGRTAKAPAGFKYETEAAGSVCIKDKAGHVLFRRPKGGLYFDNVYIPLENAETNADIDKGLAVPSITDEECSWLAARAKALYENTDYAILATTSTSIFERGAKDFGYENYLANLLSDPDLTGYYLDKLTDGYLKVLDAYLDACGDYIQILQCHDDYGAQAGMLISPDTFREVLKPYHAKIFNFVKNKKPGIKIFFHCCGAMSPILGDLIDAGVDIINPIQSSAKGMDVAALKEEFGKRVTFWGAACSTQTTMTFGTADEVRAQAQERIKILAPGGGFVFCQDHNIQPNVPPENIEALYETAQKYGRYK
jgi:uroporphyrinogen decarboxylase